MLPPLDRSFGPAVPGRFDLTLLFELSMFGTVPSAIVIVATAVHLNHLRHEAPKARPGLLLVAKLATGAALAALQLASVICWHETEMYRSAVTLAAPILSFIASLGILAIIYIAHVYVVMPSAFLSVFFSLTMLFDATMARSCLMRDELATVGGIYIAMASLKLLLAASEEVPKRGLLRTEELRAGASAEDVSGFWTRALLLWVNPLLLLGFRGNFAADDLPHIGQRFDSHELFERFQPHWKKVEKTSRVPLVRACARTLLGELLLPVLPRLCFIGFSFSRPFLMQSVMHVSNGQETSQETVHGLIGAAVFVFGGIMVSTSIYQRLEYQVSVCVRGILVMAVYDKLGRLSIDELGNSAAVTLMSTDVEGVQGAMKMLHSTWASLMELGLGIYVLYIFVGYACFLIFIPTIIAAIASGYTMKKMAKARTTWNAKIQSRVSFTSNILAQLKTIKAIGLSGVVSELLQAQRVDEIKESMHERNARVMVYGIYAFGNGITPVVIFAGARFWTRAANPMSTAEIFAAYAAIFIASMPLTRLLSFAPMYASAYACLIRLQKFLLLDEVLDGRQDLADGDEAWGEKEKQPASAMELHDVRLQSDDSKVILDKINIKIPRESTTMLHGKVGSGKSALLKALLGELAPSQGTICVASRKIAYASQTPWIQNLTIRDNVIGTSPFNESLYNQVVTACDLDKDIAALEDGDQTLAGSGGCNLSGGQKQRLGLARTLFTNVSVFILDDVLSALDAATAAAVFRNLFGADGLFKTWQSTVVMTTNRLELLGAADLVLQINDQDRSVRVKQTGKTCSVESVVARLRQRKDQNEPQPTEKAELPSVDTGKPARAPESATADRRSGDWGLYRYYFRGTSSFIIVGYLVATAIAAAMERIPQIFMRIWQSTSPSDDAYFAGFAVLSFSEILMTAGAGAIYLMSIVPRSSEQLHWELLTTVLKATLPFISHVDSGSLLARFSEDIGSVSQQLPLWIAALVSMGFNLLVDVGIVSAGARYAPPLLVLVFGLLYAAQRSYLLTSRQLRLLEVETSAPVYAHFTESAAGMAQIRAVGCRGELGGRFVTLLGRAQRPFYHLFCAQQWLKLMLDFTSLALAVTLISIAVAVPSASSDSAIGLALLNLITFTSTAAAVIRAWVNVETSLGSLARIKAFCGQTPQEQDVAAGDVPESWPSRGSIVFDNVTASYIGPNGEVREALRNTSVTIHDGQKVGISGRTGSGKSSFLLALLHLMEYSGTITIDGRDIKTVPRSILRSRITTLTQDGVELKASLRTNVFPFESQEPPTDEEIAAALRRVGLWAHVDRHGGLDGSMAEARLSHGQKQLLFLARAMLHQKSRGTRIILVDEATSSLDYGVDAQVREVMEDTFADCTVLVVAHRKDSFEGVDVMLELEGGELKETVGGAGETLESQ